MEARIERHPTAAWLARINKVLKRAFLYSLLFVFSVVLFLALTMPMKIVWPYLAPQLDLRAAGVQVQQVSGTVWHGQALGRVQGVPVLLAWRNDATALLGGRLQLDVTLTSTVGDLNGSASIGPGSVIVEVPRADVTLAGLNQSLRRERIKLDGQVRLQGLRVEWAEARPQFAEGRVVWNGGDIAYPAGREIHERNMPPFTGRLFTEDSGDIRLVLRDQDADFDVVEARLENSGEALVEVRRRLLDVANEPFPQNASEQDVVFKVKKRLFPAVQ